MDSAVNSGRKKEKMIRIAIIILVLLIGCAMLPEPQFVGQHLSLHGETFKTDNSNLKESGRSHHSNYVKYLTLNGRILMARYDDKKGVWNITVRPPHPKEVEFYMSKGEWEID